MVELFIGKRVVQLEQGTRYYLKRLKGSPSEYVTQIVPEESLIPRAMSNHHVISDVTYKSGT